jgi:hypothetical protein
MHLLLKFVAKTLSQRPAVCLLLLITAPRALSSQTRLPQVVVNQ